MDEWFVRNRCCPAHPDQIPQEYVDSAPSSSTNITREANQPSGPSTSSQVLDSDQPGTSSLASSLSGVGGRTETEVSVHVHNNESEEENIIMPRRLANDSPSQQLESVNNTNISETSPPRTPELSRREGNGDSHTPFYTPREMPEDLEDSPADAIAVADGEDLSCSPVANVSSGTAMESRRQKTIVHVDDGSIHGSPNLFDEEEIAQLASKIKTILVQESPRGRDFEET